MLEHTAMSQAQAAQEVDRYISWPGQATSYMTGYSRTAPARRGAEGRRARFDRKQFHGRVLENERRPAVFDLGDESDQPRSSERARDRHAQPGQREHVPGQQALSP